MPESDWGRIQNSKEAHRDELARLPVAQKFQILERLRERSLAMSGRKYPASSAEAATHTNATLAPPTGQGVVNFGVFGVGATLVAVITKAFQTRDSEI